MLSRWSTKQRRLDRLQQRLAILTKGLQSKADLNFASYIKEKTGYDIDIFEALRKSADVIVAQNEIRSQSELNYICTMLHIYQKTSANGEEAEKLKSLLSDYSKRTTQTSRKTEYSEVISRVEKDGIEKVTVRISTGPKPKHFEKQEAMSPDGKRKLSVVQWSDGKNASTYVTVEFPTASGAVYGLNGIYPDVKAWWKDNFTIVIETNRKYTANSQNRKVRSFDDVISIEYIEH